MNNTTKLLTAALVFVFVLSAIPTASAATLGYGTQVKLGDPDYVPTVKEATGILLQGAAAFIHYSNDATTLDEDFYAFDVDASGGLSAYDIVVAAGSASHYPVGTVLPNPLDTLYAGANPGGQGGTVTAFVYALDMGATGNGFYDLGDVVYACDTAATVHASNAAGTVFCLQLSGTGAGKILTISDDVTGLNTRTKLTAANQGFNAAAAQFAFYDVDGDGLFKGKAGELAWFTPIDVAVGGLVPQFSVRVFGATFGSQVKLGDSDYVPTVKEATGILLQDANAFIHYSNDATTLDEDFYAFDVNDDGLLSAYDIVVAAGSASHYPVGTVLPNPLDTLYAGANPGGQGGTVTAFVYALDMGATGNGFYDLGDVVYACDTAATVHASNAAGTVFCLQLSGTGAGKILTISDDVTGLNTRTKLTAANQGFNAAAAQFAFYDVDGDGLFKGKAGELAWFTPIDVAVGGLVPQFSVRVFGATFGSQVKLGDSDYVPTVKEATGILLQDANAFIHYSNDATTLDEDFYAFDVNDDGLLSAYDIVVAAGSASHYPVGTVLPNPLDTLYAGANPGGQGGTVTAFVYALDMGATGNGFYDLGDVVYACDTAATVHASNAAGTVFCLQLSGTGAGKILTISDDVTGLNTRTKLTAANQGFNAAAAQFAFYDVDGDGLFKGKAGELAWATPAAITAGATVTQFSVRLFGDAATLPTPNACPAGQTGTPPNCVTPPPTCPAGQTGTPPNCVITETCPAGQTGTPPNCVVTPPACPAGQTGTPPNCVGTPTPTCPAGQTGTPPNCVGTPTPTCPAGQTGTPPNCVTPTDTPVTTTTTPTPGFELVALVAALGAALILVRRKA